ncbi:hypothetical protein MVEN_01294800 [Mycena venus]|uniref:Uncharacterized protein n=1 Tax=Mycena venus TaxID=2733690 RepID=A0A8H6Y1B2_9AGAR|nr:hypothetical protein MVEN_01294800 [Mycena venus]
MFATIVIQFPTTSLRHHPNLVVGNLAFNPAPVTSHRVVNLPSFCRILNAGVVGVQRVCRETTLLGPIAGNQQVCRETILRGGVVGVRRAYREVRIKTTLRGRMVGGQRVCRKTMLRGGMAGNRRAGREIRFETILYGRMLRISLLFVNDCQPPLTVDSTRGLVQCTVQQSRACRKECATPSTCMEHVSDKGIEIDSGLLSGNGMSVDRISTPPLTYVEASSMSSDREPVFVGAGEVQMCDTTDARENKTTLFREHEPAELMAVDLQQCLVGGGCETRELVLSSDFLPLVTGESVGGDVIPCGGEEIVESATSIDVDFEGCIMGGNRESQEFEASSGLHPLSTEEPVGGNGGPCERHGVIQPAAPTDLDVGLPVGEDVRSSGQDGVHEPAPLMNMDPEEECSRDEDRERFDVGRSVGEPVGGGYTCSHEEQEVADTAVTGNDILDGLINSDGVNCAGENEGVPLVEVVHDFSLQDLATDVSNRSSVNVQPPSSAEEGQSYCLLVDVEPSPSPKRGLDALALPQELLSRAAHRRQSGNAPNISEPRVERELRPRKPPAVSTLSSATPARSKAKAKDAGKDGFNGLAAMDELQLNGADSSSRKSALSEKCCLGCNGLSKLTGL